MENCVFIEICICGIINACPFFVIEARRLWDNCIEVHWFQINLNHFFLPTPTSIDGNFPSTSLHKQYDTFNNIPMLSNLSKSSKTSCKWSPNKICSLCFARTDSDFIKKKYLLLLYSKDLAVTISVCLCKHQSEAQAVRAGWEMNRQKGKQTMTKQTGSDVFIVLHRTQEVKYSIAFITLQWLPE